MDLIFRGGENHMKIKFTNLLYTALAVTVLSGTGAIAQPSPSDAPDTTGPADETEQVDPGVPAEEVPVEEVPTEEVPAETEEPVAPESDPELEESDSGAEAPSITSDGSNSIVTCGPNGAAFIMANISVGCHVLKANSPPGQATNAESDE
jgi:hypothetical protein